MMVAETRRALSSNPEWSLAGWEGAAALPVSWSRGPWTPFLRGSEHPGSLFPLVSRGKLNHRITEPLRFKKTSKIPKSNQSSAPPCGFAGATADLGSSSLAWGALGAAVTAQMAQDGARSGSSPVRTRDLS